MNIKLILPTEGHKEQILEYKAEFISSGDSMDGTAGLQKCETFEEWFAALKDNSCEETVREGLVPATTFIAVDENDKIVGFVDIRHRLNDYLLEFGGHIGYSVRKSERRKGYATKMLALALTEAKNLGIDRCLITCYKENIASAKTILKNGGIYENEIPQGDNIVQRYWITI